MSVRSSVCLSETLPWHGILLFLFLAVKYGGIVEKRWSDFFHVPNTFSCLKNNVFEFNARENIVIKCDFNAIIHNSIH